MINKKNPKRLLRIFFAVRTGLEPATPCVTGMYSNQAELPHQVQIRNFVLAVRTGLEPATPCVTGMYSNQAELPHQNVLNRCSLFASAKVQLFSEMTRVLRSFLQEKLKKTYVFVFFTVVMPCWEKGCALITR